MRLKLISCEVLYREMCAVVARSPHQVDVEFLPKGLHDLGGAPMRKQLQEVIDRVDSAGYDAVLMGYGLCGNGAAGLVARAVPLVIPRVHDCIALLMGSRRRYQDYIEQHSGVYFRSTGWLERGSNLGQLTGPGYSLEELTTKYGEEDGGYLFNELNTYRQNYRQMTFISTGLEPNRDFEQKAREEAAQHGWQFETVAGDLGIFERLLSGNWSDGEFLVVPPGWRVTATYGEDILGKEPDVKS
jgi:hypothetical protein